VNQNFDGSCIYKNPKVLANGELLALAIAKVEYNNEYYNDPYPSAKGFCVVVGRTYLADHALGELQTKWASIDEHGYLDEISGEPRKVFSYIICR
jgi:hypothetical protein